MNKFFKQVSDLIIRYFILIIAAIPNLYLFYFIFTPLTFYPVYFIISLFLANISYSQNVIYLAGGSSIKLINACIAGSAYYLLLILNLSIPKIKLSRRLKILLFCWGSFLVVNILRILIASWVYMKQRYIFDITHEISWYFVSIFFVIAIWFSAVKIFKIKEIPFYSDLLFLYKNIF